MTSRFLTGLVIAGTVASIAIACAPPPVEGSEIENAAPTRNRGTGTTSSSGTTSRTKSDELNSKDPPETKGKGTTTQQQTSASSSTSGAPATSSSSSTGGTTTTSSSSSSSGAAGGSTTSSSSSSTTGGTVGGQPVCAGTATQCLSCCLQANPGSQQEEDIFGDCLLSCGGNVNCEAQCQADHQFFAAKIPANVAAHQCMQANNCLVQNFCD